MVAVANGSNLYVGVRGLGGRVYAYRLSGGTELFWHYCNGDVQAITRLPEDSRVTIVRAE